MIDLDPLRLPAETAALLLQRGTALPPLTWSDHADRSARVKLEELDDTALFGVGTFDDEPTAAIVRALLFLWHGLLDDAVMYAHAGPVASAKYVAALCHRHAGRPDEAKAAFSDMDGHEIFPALANFALQQIGDSDEPALTRFAGILKLANEWEPHLFTDLIEQARAGKVRDPVVRCVRTIQCREFELLFDHCFPDARKIERSAPSGGSDADARERVRRLSQLHSRPQQRRDQRVQSPKPRAKAPATTPNMGEKIGVACPSCHKITLLAELMRGKPFECESCGVTFRVPLKSEAA